MMCTVYPSTHPKTSRAAHGWRREEAWRVRKAMHELWGVCVIMCPAMDAAHECPPPQSSVLSANPMQVQTVVNISLSIIDGAADRFRMHMGKTEIHFLSYKPLTRSTVYRYLLYFYTSLGPSEIQGSDKMLFLGCVSCPALRGEQPNPEQAF